MSMQQLELAQIMSSQQKEPAKELIKCRTQFVDKVYPGLYTCQRNMFINRPIDHLPRCECSCENPRHRCQYAILCSINMHKIGNQMICGYCRDHANAYFQR